MKRILTPMLICLTLNLIAQQNEKEQVLDVVNRVFEAMRTNDSTLLKQSFVENPNMFTAFIDQEGNSKLVEGDFKKFINAVGSPKKLRKDGSKWSFRHNIYTKDGDLSAKIDVDGAWLDLAKRRTTVPPAELSDLLVNGVMSEDFEWIPDKTKA